MDITNRVQIVPLGYEKVRVLGPVYEYKADRVVILHQDPEKDYEAEFQKEIVEELRDNDRIDLEIRYCDIFNHNSALETIAQVIRDYEDEEVYVNVSTGSKITAIAAMMACQSMGATPFYVEPQLRNDAGDREPPKEPIVTDISDVYELPVFELQGPSREQIEILAYLRDEGGASKKDLIRFAESREFPFISESKSTGDEGLYRLLDSHVVEPLSDGSYIKIESIGRTKHVHLDERGRDVLRAFPADGIE